MTVAAYIKNILLRMFVESAQAENPVPLAPPPPEDNSQPGNANQPENTSQPGAMPQNRTRYWAIIGQDSLGAVLSDTTRYKAPKAALSNWSLQELSMLEWAGREESQATYISPQPPRGLTPTTRFEDQ